MPLEGTRLLKRRWPCFFRKTSYAHTRYPFIYRSRYLTLTETEGARNTYQKLSVLIGKAAHCIYAADGLLQGNGMLWKSNCLDMNL